MRFTFAVAAALALACCSRTPAQNFSIDFSQSRQTIQGFGITATGTWNAEIANLYGQASFQNQVGNDLGASIIRLALPPQMQSSQDLNPSVLNLASFNFGAFDPPANFIQALRAAHPELKVMLSIWTPPAWMKTNNSLINGGTLRADRREHFGKYCAAACIGFQQTYGVPVYGISIQNEPAFAQTYDSCVYTPAEMRLALEAVKAAFAKWDVTTRIMAPEDVSETPRWLSFVREIVPSQPTSRGGVSILNIHGFPNWPANGAEGWKDLRARMRNIDLPIWMTEVSGEEPTWLGQGMEGRGGLFLAQEIHEAIVFGECEAWVYWAISDPSPSEFALMDRANPTPKYHAAKQYFKHIRPGAVRNPVTPVNANVLVSAYHHEQDKRVTIVLVNLNAVNSPVVITLDSLPGTASSFQTYRSSSNEGHVMLSPTTITGGGQVVMTLKNRSVTTLTTTYAPGVLGGDKVRDAK
jgi:glucuronoarabinoxylan endo-1,4-beta-xylanase